MCDLEKFTFFNHTQLLSWYINRLYVVVIVHILITCEFNKLINCELRITIWPVLLIFCFEYILKQLYALSNRNPYIIF